MKDVEELVVPFGDFLLRFKFQGGNIANIKLHDDGSAEIFTNCVHVKLVV